MGALLYVTKRSFLNRLRMALKKPLTYLAIAGILFYVVVVGGSLVFLMSEFQFDSAYGLFAVMTVWTFYMFFGNMASYGRRKGIIFRPSHAHFIFTAPISPKVVLLHAAAWNFLLSLLMSIVFTLLGILVFHVPLWRMLLVFFISFVLEVAIESGMIIFLYANERFSEKVITRISHGIFWFLGIVSALGIFYFWKNGLSLRTVHALLDMPALLMIPGAGWNIAALRLVLLGPDLWNLIGIALYLLTVVAAVVLAVRMKCTGAYYEDAVKFADDCAEMKKKKNSGEMVTSIGKRKRFKNASVEYKGTGAKAIFYRQMLEYKKEKFFIFGTMTVIALLVPFFLLYMAHDFPEEISRSYFLLAGVAYATFIGSGYSGKWEKELKSPYLYLIPDTATRKLWYSTQMEHIKALIDGTILVVPLGIYWRVPVWQLLCGVLVYVALQANKLYSKILIEAFLGNIFGQTGKTLVRMLVASGVIGIGVVCGVMTGVLIRVELVFPMILVYSILATLLIAALATARFGAMEQIE